MKHFLKKATFCTGVVLVFFGVSLCMDGQENKDLGLLLGKRKQVLLLLKKRLHLFNHHTLCSLAINKEWDKHLKDTAPERKQELTAWLQDKHDYAIAQHFLVRADVWHKYGTAWGVKTCCTDYQCYALGTGCDSVALQALYFGDQEMRCTDWGSAQAIPGLEKPKFNEAGNIICYGLAKKRRGNHAAKHVREYGLNNNITCWLLLKNDPVMCKNFIKLLLFKSFPSLLKVFLDGLEMHDSKKFKFCDLNKVIIPDNYQECVPNDEYQSYNQLPEWWRELIDNRYAAQHKK